MPEFIDQKLSAMVKARLLFKREIEIDSVSSKIFDDQFLSALQAKKEENDHEMKKISKVMISSVFLSAFYHFWGAC